MSDKLYGKLRFNMNNVLRSNSFGLVFWSTCAKREIRDQLIKVRTIRGRHTINVLCSDDTHCAISK